jgi:hypothetical protein
MSQTKLIVHRIPKTDLLFFRQIDGKDFFVSANNGFIVSISMLARILVFLVKSGILSIKTIEGVLEECKE